MSGSPARRRLLGLGIAAGALVVIVGAAWLLARSAAERPPEPLYPMPAFELTRESGQPFGSRDLAGRVVVASFVFTRCPTVCPRLSARMAKLQERLADEEAVRLVSFSVDPAYDTPERLRAYGEGFGQDPARWIFLTGETRAVRTAVETGFKIGVRGEGIDLVHGEHMVLVDPQGSIRGYYGADDAELERLARDARALAPSRAGASR